MASKIDLSPRCIRRPLQQHGSFSAKCGANGIAHHEAIAAASRVRTRVEIGGIRHRAVRGLISSAHGKFCGDRMSTATSEFGTKQTCLPTPRTSVNGLNDLNSPIV